MIWYYSCPNCRQEVEIPWDKIKDEKVCPHCQNVHFPPTPGEDHTAYVSGETWPPDMEEAVVVLRGSACIAPGCYREHTTLVLRVPSMRGGRLSVENLLPACAQHAATRGEDDYVDWLARVAGQEASIVPSGITITHSAAESVPFQSFGPVQSVQPVAGRVLLPGPFPAGVRLLFAAPFVPGQARRVVLYYEWLLEPGESCRVILGAWPRTDQPDFARGFRDSKYFVTNEHRAATVRSSSALLELVVSESNNELWTAAGWVEFGQEREVITSYFLGAAVDEQDAEAF